MNVHMRILKKVPDISGFAYNNDLKLLSPTHVKSDPGGWWFLSKFVKAINIMNINGIIVSATVSSVGIDKTVIWNFSCLST